MNGYKIIVVLNREHFFTINAIKDFDKAREVYRKLYDAFPLKEGYSITMIHWITEATSLYETVSKTWPFDKIKQILIEQNL